MKVETKKVGSVLMACHKCSPDMQLLVGGGNLIKTWLENVLAAALTRGLFEHKTHQNQTERWFLRTSYCELKFFELAFLLLSSTQGEVQRSLLFAFIQTHTST